MGEKIITTNRKARFEYEIIDKWETGIVLLGTEVKALRAGRANLKDSHANIKDGEIFLLNTHISPYSHGNKTALLENVISVFFGQCQIPLLIRTSLVL